MTFLHFPLRGRPAGKACVGLPAAVKDGPGKAKPGALGRTLAAVAAAGLLASCAVAPTPTRGTFSEADYGVKASPRVVAAGKPVPKGGGRAMVGEPYRVAGKTYVPRDNPDYSATGLASWYGSDFHGRKTANGEVFDMNDLTAAHPTLPLPSYVRVTNLGNGRSVIVRVNDRGPFTHGRIIDVSSTAAAMLDFKRTGVAKVQVDYVSPARMDGRDRDMLVASYRGPGPAAAPAVAVASRRPEPSARTITVADARRTNAPGGQPEVMAIGPTPTGFEDPLGPLILRSGFVNSYAEEPRRATPAHTAAAELAAGAGIRSTLPPQPIDTWHNSAGTVVQLGAFSDPANAERVGARFERFGRVSIATRTSGESAIRVVSVTIDRDAVTAETVIKAAAAAGLTGAFVVSR